MSYYVIPTPIYLKYALTLNLIKYPKLALRHQ